MDGLFGVFSVGLFWVLISLGIAHMQNIKTAAAHAARPPNFTHVNLGFLPPLRGLGDRGLISVPE